MKRVLSLVLALVLVLGMIPTFAADATGAQALYDNGFITGKDGADLEAKLDVNAQLTRAQLAALIAELNGAKEEAAAFEQPADFTDFATIAGWAKNFVSYAAVNGWMNGFTDGTFRANASVPAQQLAAVLMNALGYDVVWNTVLADAAELGIVVEGTALTRGEAFEAMWVAVSEVKMADSDMTLGQHLGKLTPPVVVPTELMITSVTANNLKEIVVTFNQAVDKTTVVDTNFSLSPSAGTLSPSLSEDGKTVTVTAENAKGEAVNFDADYCIVAVGRTAYTEGLGLDKIGITVEERGKKVPVNEHLETSVAGVYAIGDVITGAMLAHKAEDEGTYVAETIAGQKPHINYNLIPGVVYTWPEVASVGLTEEQLKEKGTKYKAGSFPFKASGRAKASMDTDGFIKVLADAATDEVLGVHMIGPRAADMIAEAVIAMEFRASAEDIARTCHAHPTYTEALKEAALAATDNRAIHI